MDSYLLGNLDQQAAFSGYDQFSYFDDQTLFSNGFSLDTDLCTDSTLNAPQACYQPDAIQNPASSTVPASQGSIAPGSDDQLSAYFVSNVNCVANAPASAELDSEFVNSDLKSLKNFFYTEDDETFLENYLDNYESDLRPETLNDYANSGKPEVPARFEGDNEKPEVRSSLDDFIRTELVGVTEDFELNYELDTFELPPELNERINVPQFSPIPELECKPPGPCDQTKQQNLIRCNLCPYSSFDKHKIKHHYLTHSKAGPFSCGKCGSKFGQFEALKAHFIKNHSAEAAVQCDPTTGTDFRRGQNFLERQTNLNEQIGQMNQMSANLKPNQMLSRDRLRCQSNSQLSSRMGGMMNEQVKYQMMAGNPSGHPVAGPLTVNRFHNPLNSSQMTGQTNQGYRFNQMNQSNSANFRAFPYHPIHPVQNSSPNSPCTLGNHQMGRIMSDQTIGQFGFPENHLSMIGQDYSAEIFDFMY